MSVAEQLMPIAPGARTKSDGSAYTAEDKEMVSVMVGGVAQLVARVPYFELEQNGGIRRYVPTYFPMTVFQAYADASTQGKVQLRTEIAKNEAHLADLKARGWYGHPTEATDAHEGSLRAIAESAARAAHQAERMTDPAKRDYKRRSAESPDHITE